MLKAHGKSEGADPRQRPTIKNDEYESTASDNDKSSTTRDPRWFASNIRDQMSRRVPIDY